MPLLPILLAACAAQSPSPDAAGAGAAAAGHQRMLELLRAVDAEARHSNLYLGRDVVDQLRARLEDASQPLAPADRYQTLLQLSREELRIGLVQEAIEHAEAALRAVQGQAGAPPKAVAEARFLLGTCHLRLGELQNCCNARTPESCILPIQGGGVHRDPTGSERAYQEFLTILETSAPGSPMAIKSRWTLNLAAMTLGWWPHDVPEAWRIAPEVFASDPMDASGRAFPRFPELAQASGVDFSGLAGGCVAEDFNGDGRPDLMFTDSDTAGQMRLFLQRASGKWEDVTIAAGLEGLYGGLNLIQGDYDGDGDVDALVLRGAWWRGGGRHPNSLLQNDGGGKFRDVTFAAGLGAVHAPTQAADFADYDNDGDLDLYVGNETDPESPVPSQLFQNQGDGTFRDVAQAAGVTNDRYSKGAVWGDFDEDGWQDLYVSNMSAPNRLYRNRGDGSFEDVAARAGVERPMSAFGCFAWDFDQDGHLDLWVGSFGSAEFPPNVANVAASYLGLPHRAEPAQLYRGDGKGRFEEVSRKWGLDLVTLPMGCNFGDLNGDGYPDFYLATGYPLYEGLVPNVMYLNDRGRGFLDVTTAGGFGHLQKGHGVAFADLDRDGDQDVVARMGGSYPGDPYGNLLFQNPGFDARWLKLRLVGVRSNRFGVGARIEVQIEEGGGTRTVHATVGTGGSFGGNPLQQELGLGAAEGGVARVTVRWPGSGLVQVLEKVPLDSTIRLVEGEVGFFVLGT